MLYKLTIVLFCLFLFLPACGGGDSGGENAKVPTILEGRFLDSAVCGLNYSTGSQSGITDEDGKYLYKTGENVIFSIGDIVIGDCLAKQTLTAIDLIHGAFDETDPYVNNIVRFLI